MLLLWHQTLEILSNESRAACYSIFERSSKRKFTGLRRCTGGSFRALRAASGISARCTKAPLDRGGLFACNIRSNGTVASVDVVRSTGHQMLDQAAITAFRQWRFEPGDKLKLVNIPMTFWMDGSAARCRMSGAVISDDI